MASSVFTSRITQTISVPHDAGQTVTIRKLAPRHLEQARKISQLKSIGDLRDLGGPAFLKELQSISTDAIATAVKTNPLMLYDALTLLEKGITAWSYDAPLNSASYEDLDSETAEFLAREILKLAKPSLFETAEETEAARGNDSAPSTAV